jgi:hypothetical protein
MSDVANQSAELSGWKEIAGHLRVSIRTAQTLEREQDLPVHRGAGKKGPVFAKPVELDQWRTRVQNRQLGSAEPVLLPDASTRRDWLRSVSFGGAIVAAAAAGYAIPKLNLGGKEIPSGYRIEGATLVVLGKDGGELWRHTLPEQLNEAAYTAGVIGRKCVFADVDGDGRAETVFSYSPHRLESERSLVCFSANGRIMWTFVPGKSVIDNLGREFTPPFWPAQFEVLQSRHSAVAQIVVSSNHSWSFPTQVAVLDGKTGKLVSEYWHRGHLLYMAVADLDGDGEVEVLLGGVNDAPEYKQATLVVFDHRQIAGATPNSAGGTYFQGMPPGTEKKTVFFPKTPLSQRLEFNRVSFLVVAGGRIRVNVAESTDERDPAFVVYELDYHLQPVSVTLSNGMMERYKEGQRFGKLPTESMEDIAERLERGIRVL